jgi:hypothetical protein
VYPAYAVLGVARGAVHARIERVSHDVDAVTAQMRRDGLPDGLADRLGAAV